MLTFRVVQFCAGIWASVFGTFHSSLPSLAWILITSLDNGERSLLGRQPRAQDHSWVHELHRVGIPTDSTGRATNLQSDTHSMHGSL